MAKRKFNPGQMVATIGVLELMRLKGFDLQGLMLRHIESDWGDVTEATRRENERALSEGGRLMSVYDVEGQRVFVVTDADRTLTKAMLSEDF